MNDGSQFIDIILFAMVAVFLGLRLRSVLGRRTGNEPPAVDAGFGGANAGRPDNVVRMAQRRRPPVDVPELPAGEPVSKSGVGQIRSVDPGFSPEGFLQGAQGAFEMIVRGFAAGDERLLRPLLSDEVFENFARAIGERRAAGETSLTELVGIKVAEIVEGGLDGRMAHVTVRFVSQQRILVKDAEGRIIEGDPDRTTDITDVWTFARDTRSPNPNWLLVATRSHDE